MICVRRGPKKMIFELNRIHCYVQWRRKYIVLNFQGGWKASYRVIFLFSSPEPKHLITFRLLSFCPPFCLRSVRPFANIYPTEPDVFIEKFNYEHQRLIPAWIPPYTLSKPVHFRIFSPFFFSKLSTGYRVIKIWFKIILG